MDKFKEILHVINNARPMQWIMLIFCVWITLDFHNFYKLHFFEFEEWQNVGVLAYAGMVIGIFKIVGDAVFKKREKDD